jgi:hypothetical protein
MTHFAKRFVLEENTESEVEQVAKGLAESDCELLEALWTPTRGQVFSVYEGELAPKTANDESVEVFPVLQITAEEYGPAGVEPAAGEGDELQLVLVRRQLPPMTTSEFRAVGVQAIMCAHEYTDMRWLRSYWDTGQNQLNCLFRTRTHDLVREHAERSRIPCDEIHDAIEIAPRA